MTRALVFIVGAVSLAGQVTWSRLAATVVGGTFAAWAITLAGAMAGLSLGAAWAGVRPPRRLGTLLGACGLTLMLMPHLILEVGRLEGMPAARLILTALLLSLAHLPFGAFLPSVIPRTKINVGQLYALGSAGAVLGALAAGEILPSVLALDHIGFLLGLLTLASSGLLPRQGVATHVEPEPRREAIPRSLLFTAFALGLLGLVAESLWMRVLGFYWESNTLCFALVTAATVAGLSVGSWAAARVGRRWTLGRDAAGIALGIAALTLAGAAVGSPLAVEATGSVERIGTTLLLVGVPATAFGAAFVILIGCVTGSSARAVGFLSGANSAGAAAGPLLLCAGAPWISWPPQMLILIAAGYAALLVAVAGRRAAWTGILLAATLGLGGWNFAEAGPALANYGASAGLTVPFLRPSLESTVAVTRETRTGMEIVWIDRGFQGDTSPLGRRIPEQLGNLPCEILGRPPRRAMVIGLGTGITLSAIVDSGAEAVDVAELSQGVIEANRTILSEVNAHVLAKHGVKIHHGDGRTVLLDAATPYDLIVTDMIFPTVLGAGNLFSREFYALARRRLTQGGLFVHWVPCFLLSPEDLASTARAFLDVFPEGSACIGSFGPRRLVLGLAGGLPLTASTSSRFALGPSGLRNLAGVAAPMRDADPRLETRSRQTGEGRFGTSNLKTVMNLMEGSPVPSSRAWLSVARAGLAEMIEKGGEADFHYREASLLAPGQTDAEFHLACLAYERNLKAAGEASGRRDSDAMLKSLRKAASYPGSGWGNVYLADALASRGRFQEAAVELEKAVAKSPRSAEVHWRQALVARELNDQETARRAIEAASALASKVP